MGRKRYVYKLDIDYPDEFPENLINSLMGAGSWMQRWPRERAFLSYSSAERRASNLRQCGCQVTIIRSKPIEWDGPIPSERFEPIPEERIRKTGKRLQKIYQQMKGARMGGEAAEQFLAEVKAAREAAEAEQEDNENE